jgi:hypothetical protein
MFASPSQIEAITAENFSNSVVCLSLGMRQKLQWQNWQTFSRAVLETRSYPQRLSFMKTYCGQICL